MKITTLSRTLALQNIFENLAVPPGGTVPFFHIVRYWRDTGLRRADLEVAVELALKAGELIEQYSDEGRLLMLTELGQVNSRYKLDTRNEIEDFSSALDMLERARLRRSGKITLIPRVDDLPRAATG